MKPLEGAIVKSVEISVVYPINRIINYQYLTGHTFSESFKEIYYSKSLYKGIKYQISSSFINRYADIYLYEKYGASLQSAVLSSLFKGFTYPLNTIEINIQAGNKNYRYYSGFKEYFIINTCSYYIFWNCMKFYSEIFNGNIPNPVSGFLTGITVELLMNPLKIIKTNYQTSNKFRNINFRLLNRALLPRMLLSGFQVAFFNTLIPIH
jgi:hypothetical protein